ncbi:MULTISPECIES: heavy-metal-associated domain-containing protein [Pseudoxanthomonas]|jgi:copper chaperone|uniref:Copper chaperone n=1 Tax=Pseudoxanthomonas winnipegensis TaxID=2480810 RepID=A0AAW8G6W8_9GAMM|nr:MULTISPECIES: heavy-metal-associated domain-containing protein [Pseudoxanthomonas]MDQ1118037.1 copper chaperone [Pseudoxanthomonas winnipegensis]MDQ1135007.1 copper chaperone [Pseudoxanthomonas winnipegensis]MDR6138761.1 copper chaperone [Pseudoxanthomonas sp. SORGH_AS_0997]WJI14984.1 heavy-metal-associated domain-containing protein [Pseudoxanthomonas winnipegensis]
MHIELTVDGMKCGGCSGRLKRVLEGTDGVQATQIVLETKQVAVDFDEAGIDVDAIKHVITDAGFTVLAA